MFKTTIHFLMDRINFRGSNIFYTKMGTGETIIFLHGFLEDSQIWDPFTEDLKQKYRLVLVDLFGHGQSENVDGKHSMESMAEAVYQILAENSIERARLIGHSMGGYVSLAFAEKYPEMVSGLILINSTPKADSTARKKDRDRAIKILSTNKTAFVNMAIKNLFTPETRQRCQHEIDQLLARAQKLPAENIIASVKGMKNRIDRTNILTNFQGHKTLIAGKNDPILDYDTIKNIARETKSDIKTLPDGHMSYLENEQELKAILNAII